MEVIIDRPPMFEEIDAAFKVAGKSVIFTWGSRIYNPQGCEISPALKAHESVHAQRQGTDEESIRGWWRRYIDDLLFRYDEELAAHRAEYRAFKSWTKDRNALERYLQQVAQRLASPLYGGVTTYLDARRAIVAERP